jgi:Asp/Glu/hydantoin racemase
VRILCMLPAGKGIYPPEAEERRLAIMRSYSTSATQVDADYMPGTSGFNPWGGREPRDPAAEGSGLQRGAELSAQLAMKAEQEGYDAFCPYGTLDIGVREARARVTIPVVGQTEACLLFCKLLDRKFAGCFYMPGRQERFHQLAHDAGAMDLYVADTAIGIPNSEYPRRRPELLEQFVRCTREAKANGAELMGLVAMSICPGEYAAKELSEASGFPVLDALACQIAMAEWWYRTGLPPSLLRMPR